MANYSNFFKKIKKGDYDYPSKEQREQSVKDKAKEEARKKYIESKQKKKKSDSWF